MANSLFGSNQMADDAKKTASSIGDAFRGLFQAFSGGDKPITNLTQGLGKFVGATGAAVGAVMSLGQTIGALVGKANPALLQRFEQTLDDVSAVVGRALIPVFETITSVMRAFGDTLATFAGTIGGVLSTIASGVMPVLLVQFEVFGRIGQALGGVLKSLGPVFSSIGAVMAGVFKAFQPLIDLLVDTLGGVLVTVLGNLAKVVEFVAVGVITLTQALGAIVGEITGWVRDLLEYVGILDPERSGTKPGSSVGAAARNASFSDPSSVLKAAQASAFGAGAGDRAEIRIAKSIESKVQDIVDAITDLPKNIAIAIREKAKETVNNAVDDVKKTTGVTEGGWTDAMLFGNPITAPFVAAQKAYSWGRDLFGSGVVSGK